MKDSDQIKKELQDISPFLAGLRKPQNDDELGIPANYFEQFGAKLEARLQDEKEAPKPTKIMAIDSQTPKAAPKAKVIDMRWAHRVSYLLVAAAAVALIVVAAPWADNSPMPDSTAVFFAETRASKEATLVLETLDEISPEEAEAYVEKHIEDFEEEQITNAYIAEANQQKTEPLSPQFEASEAEAIKDYLQDDAQLDDFSSYEIDELY